MGESWRVISQEGVKPPYFNRKWLKGAKVELYRIADHDGETLAHSCFSHFKVVIGLLRMERDMGEDNDDFQLISLRSTDRAGVPISYDGECFISHEAVDE